MRQNYAVAALVAVLMIGFGMKLFSARTADAEVRQNPGIDVSTMHGAAALPTQNVHDMSFVF